MIFVIVTEKGKAILYFPSSDVSLYSIKRIPNASKIHMKRETSYNPVMSGYLK